MRRIQTHAARGQSLVEFTLVLPILLLIMFAFVQLLLVLRAQSALTSVANVAAGQASLSGGETRGLDTEIAHLAGQNGIVASLVRVRIDTDGGAGAWHWADGHDGPTSATQAAAYPPPASYNGDVTVHLTYAYPLALPFVPLRSWTVAADISEASQMDEGVLPQ